MTSAEQLKARVLEAARREPSPAREDVTRRSRRAIQGAMIASLLVFLAIGGVHTHKRPPDLFLRSLIAWASVAFTSTWLAVGRGYSMLGRPRAWLFAGALSTPVLLGALWFLWTCPLGGAWVPHSFLTDAACFGASLALGLGPLVAFLFMRAEGDPVHPGLAGAALGAAAGAWGTLLIDLHCELTDPRHILLGHLLPTAALVVIGAIAGRWALTIKLRAR